MTPFLLVPGLNCTARVFASATDTLWRFGPVSIANHCEGDGLSDVAAKILEQAPARFALLGFSFGGYLAFEIWRQAPERVIKLALVDTTARPDSAEMTETRRRRIDLAKGGKFPLVVNQSFPNSVHPDRANDATLFAIHGAMARANGPEIYIRQQEAIISRPDSRPTMGTITVPTQIIVGDNDDITPPEHAREMHARINLSRLAVIPDAGHMALLEQPEAVGAVLKAWASL